MPPQVAEADHRSVQISHGHAQQRVGGQRRHAYLDAIDLLAAYVRSSRRQAGDEAVQLLPAGGAVDEQRAVAQLDD